MTLIRNLLLTTASASLTWLSCCGTSPAQVPRPAAAPDYFAPGPNPHGDLPAPTRLTRVVTQDVEGTEPSPSDIPPAVVVANEYESYDEEGGGRWSRFVANQRDCWWGYPELFIEPAFGSRVYGSFNAQIARGNATRLTLYHYDFAGRTDKLTDRGRKQVAKFGPEMENSALDLLIQETPRHPKLDAARRAAVLAELAALGHRLDARRVVVAEPRAAGLTGNEALLIQGNLNRQTTRGTGGPSMNESFRSYGFGTGGGTSGGSSTGSR